MGIKGLKVFGDVDVIIQNVNKTFQEKHRRLKAYRDEVWRLKYSFNNFSISYNPIMKKQLFDSLVVSSSILFPPLPPKLMYEVQKLKVPPGLSSSQAQAIKLRSAKFYINKNLIYWNDPSGILLRCLDKEKAVEVIHQFHSSICGGHHYWKTKTHKILRPGYYWPTLFSDVFSFVKSSDKCQRFTGRQQLNSLPLKLVHVNGPFQQWGLDFIGEINRHSSGQHKWILVATDYFTKWIEAIPIKNSNHQVVIKFLNENIFTRFCCPTKLVTNNAVAFKLILPIPKFLQEEQDEANDMVTRMNNLVEIQQIREQLVEKSKAHQKKIKENFDRKEKVDNFQVSD
eukprot:PITA_33201